MILSQSVLKLKHGNQSGTDRPLSPPGGQNMKRTHLKINRVLPYNQWNVSVKFHAPGSNGSQARARKPKWDGQTDGPTDRRTDRRTCQTLYAFRKMFCGGIKIML